MKLGMVIYGSNGDVEMFVALAMGLIKNSHKVDLYIVTINGRDYSFLNEHEGLTVHQKLFDTSIRNKANTNVEFWREPFWSRYKLLYGWYDKVSEDLISYAYKCCKESEIVIGSQDVLELSCIAEKLNVPYVSIRAFPGNIRTTYESPYWASTSNSKSNEELWDINDSYLNKLRKRHINKFRKQISLPTITNVIQEVIYSHTLNLISYSRHLHSKKPDWPDNVHMCGHFNAHDNYIDWTLPQKLKGFIDNDIPPVLISLGSMLEYENDLEAFHDLLLSVASQIKRKVIFHSSWNHGDVIEGNVYKLSGFISYPKLLAHCALVVHHAGVGTAHIVTESGCPSVVIEYGFEQPFNTLAFIKKKISSGGIPRAELSVSNLLLLINQALEDKEMKKRAEDISKLMHEEDGVSTAVNLIEEVYEKITLDIEI